MEQITFKRTGDRPLMFMGSVIERSNPDMDGVAGRQYSGTLAITEAGTYVVQIRYRTQWERDEIPMDYVTHGQLDAVAKWLREFDYMAPVVGCPDGVMDAERRNKILRGRVQHAWLELVGDLIGDLEPETID